MTIAGEIRKQIEKNKELKLAVGEINNHLSVLEGLTRKDIMEQVDEAYQTGYDKGYADKTNNDEVCNKIAKDIQDEGYQRGLNDAWEAARKIVTWPDRSLVNSDTFDLDPGENIFTKYSASEAIERLKSYEEKQDDKFEFGDEIIDSWGVKGCVVSKDNEGFDTMYALFDGCRVPQYVTQSNFHKTGKHYDIEKILEGIKHD